MLAVNSSQFENSDLWYYSQWCLILVILNVFFQKCIILYVLIKNRTHYVFLTLFYRNVSYTNDYSTFLAKDIVYLYNLHRHNHHIYTYIFVDISRYARSEVKKEVIQWVTYMYTHINLFIAESVFITHLCHHHLGEGALNPFCQLKFFSLNTENKYIEAQNQGDCLYKLIPL